MSPGPISVTTDELIRDITEERHEKYAERYEKFIETYNPWDTGEASKKVLREFLCGGKDMVGA